jgi:hypothetical protein
MDAIGSGYFRFGIRILICTWWMSKYSICIIEGAWML